jgi:hypothetical protein
MVLWIAWAMGLQTFNSSILVIIQTLVKYQDQLNQTEIFLISTVKYNTHRELKHKSTKMLKTCMRHSKAMVVTVTITPRKCTLTTISQPTVRLLAMATININH